MEGFQHKSAAPVIDSRPDRAGNIGCRQRGTKRFARCHADERPASGQSDALGQGEGGADSREAAGADDCRQSIECRGREARFGQDDGDQRRQASGMTAFARHYAFDQHAAILPERGRALGQRGVEGEDAHDLALS